MSEAVGVIRVVLGRAVVGLMVRDGVVVDVAPYLRRRGYTGRDARQVWRELRRQGLDVQWLPAEQ